MTIIDAIIMVLILTGAGYLFYKSFIKKKGCSTCSVAGCELKKIRTNKFTK